jgi:hypothetical protein
MEANVNHAIRSLMWDIALSSVGLALAAIMILLALSQLAHGQSQTVIRDASGRATGTATTDSQGTTTFRDDRGRTIGTASPNGTTGTTTFRDDRGRTVGTTTRPSR